MPGPTYYRQQAELFASLALANTNDVYLLERYTALAKKYLAKAADPADEEPGKQMPAPPAIGRSDGSDMDRD